jgi:hypothetical protein
MKDEYTKLKTDRWIQFKTVNEFLHMKEISAIQWQKSWALIVWSLVFYLEYVRNLADLMFTCIPYIRLMQVMATGKDINSSDSGIHSWNRHKMKTSLVTISTPEFIHNIVMAASAETLSTNLFVVYQEWFSLIEKRRILFMAKMVRHIATGLSSKNSIWKIVLAYTEQLLRLRRLKYFCLSFA